MKKEAQPEQKVFADIGDLIADFAPSFPNQPEAKSAVFPNTVQPNFQQEIPAPPANNNNVPQMNTQNTATESFVNIPTNPNAVSTINPPPAAIPSQVQPAYVAPSQSVMVNNQQPVIVNPPQSAMISTQQPAAGMPMQSFMANPPQNQFEENNVAQQPSQQLGQQPPLQRVNPFNNPEQQTSLVAEQKQEESPEKHAAFDMGQDNEAAASGNGEGKRERLPSDYNEDEKALLQKRQQADMERRSLLVERAQEEQKKKKEMQKLAEQDLKNWIE